MRAFKGIQGLAGVGPDGRLRIHEHDFLRGGGGVAAGVHHRVHTVVHQIARNAQTRCRRGIGRGVFPRHVHRGALAQQASVKHQELREIVAQNDVLHARSHLKVAASGVGGVFHLKHERRPQGGRFGVRHVQGEVGHAGVAATVHCGDLSVDGVARPFVVDGHLGVNPRHFHLGIHGVACQRPVQDVAFSPNSVRFSPSLQAAVGHGQAVVVVLAVHAAGHVQEGFVQGHNRRFVVHGVKGLQERAFVAASVDGGVRPHDQPVRAATFLGHRLCEREVHPSAVLRHGRNVVEVAARNGHVHGHVVEGRAFCVLHRDDLRVLGRVARCVDGSPGPHDLELGGAVALIDLLRVQHLAARVLRGFCAPRVRRVPTGAVVVNLHAGDLNGPRVAVISHHFAPLQGLVLRGAQEDGCGGVQTLPALDDLLARTDHRVHGGVHQLHVLVVASGCFEFGQGGVGHNVSGQAGH